MTLQVLSSAKILPMQRRPTPELLDTDSGTPKEISDSLSDLRWFNRWFGGIATSRELLTRVSNSRLVAMPPNQRLNQRRSERESEISFGVPESVSSNSGVGRLCIGRILADERTWSVIQR